MTKMMCTICQYTLETESPPEICPSCKNNCAFVDVTCYTPECGSEDQVNPDQYKK